MKGLAKEEIKIEHGMTFFFPFFFFLSVVLTFAVVVLSNTGGFGVVYKGEARKSPVAIKIPRNALSPKQIEDFRKEVAILSSVFHPNICLFLGAYVGENEIIIVNELLEVCIFVLLFF